LAESPAWICFAALDVRRRMTFGKASMAICGEWGLLLFKAKCKTLFKMPFRDFEDAVLGFRQREII